jgi:hypothetical protein
VRCLAYAHSACSVSAYEDQTHTWDFRRRASAIGRTRRTSIEAAQWFRAEYQIPLESTG